MSETMSVQWFPGHMAKTRRLMAEHMKMVDIVVELCDARIPGASRNPEVDKMVGQKPRILLLNKSDFADDEQTRRWCAHYREKGIAAIPVDCRSGKGLGALMPTVREALAVKIAAWEKSGATGRPIRMMIVGIPNVGKSSLINRLAGGKRAKVEDRPGVTRGKQWVALKDGCELLDMPGVLWPKFEDPAAGELLAFTGAVRDEILDAETMGMRLLDVLREQGYGELLPLRYGIEDWQVTDLDSYDLMEAIGRKRGMLMAGGRVNLERASVAVVDEFRGGVLGKITLEKLG